MNSRYKKLVETHTFLCEEYKKELIGAHNNAPIAMVIYV
jgi:hypothetical protein